MKLIIMFLILTSSVFAAEDKKILCNEDNSPLVFNVVFNIEKERAFHTIVVSAVGSEIEPDKRKTIKYSLIEFPETLRFVQKNEVEEHTLNVDRASLKYTRTHILRVYGTILDWEDSGECVIKKIESKRMI